MTDKQINKISPQRLEECAEAFAEILVCLMERRSIERINYKRRRPQQATQKDYRTSKGLEPARQNEPK